VVFCWDLCWSLAGVRGLLVSNSCSFFAGIRGLSSSDSCSFASAIDATAEIDVNEETTQRK
jgi:hypothetical protein